ncbi:condensation domain-containing protein [Streptomyces sp. NPDC088251]|uniref:condensation domain-containing protein n=1 Tax=unclassified Streptomyces TaxID=2593676 RepID=UPI0037F715C0
MSAEAESVHLPLTAGQELHWLGLSRNPDWLTGVWRLQKISGNLDPDTLVSGINDTVKLHTALRVGVSARRGEPQQFVRECPPASRLVTAKNIRSDSLKQFDRYVERLWCTEIVRPWDLVQDYPFRFFLLRHSSAYHVLLAGFSHLAVDGTACNLILSDIWEKYGGSRDARPDDGRYIAAVANHPGRRAGGSVAAERHWANRAAAIPPAVQFRGEDEQTRPDTEPAAAYRPLRLDGESLAAMRQAVAAADCSEFQWILAVFAASIFSVSLLDRVKLSVVVDMRGSAERDISGMFAVRVPLIIDRQSAPELFLPHVRSQLLQSIKACRRAGPLEAHMALERKTGELGRPLVDDLSINYVRAERTSADRRSAGIDITETSAPEGARFETAGLDFQVLSRPDSLTYSFIANEKVMPTSVQGQFLAAFRAALPTGAAAVPDAPAPAGAASGKRLSRLTDPQGQTVFVVDTRELASEIKGVEEVARVDVDVCKHEGTMDVLRARVVARGDLSAEALCSHLGRVAQGSRFLTVPQSMAIEREEWMNCPRDSHD